jgi:hypothetical protein
MPRILELKDIDGELWVRLGEPGDFPSGVALWTPEEQKREKELAVYAYIAEQELND